MEVEGEEEFNSFLEGKALINRIKSKMEDIERRLSNI